MQHLCLSWNTATSCGVVAYKTRPMCCVCLGIMLPLWSAFVSVLCNVQWLLSLSFFYLTTDCKAVAENVSGQYTKIELSIYLMSRRYIQKDDSYGLCLIISLPQVVCLHFVMERLGLYVYSIQTAICKLNWNKPIARVSYRPSVVMNDGNDWQCATRWSGR